MYDELIVSKMNDYLHRAAQALAAWLFKMLPQTGDDWWEECVLSNLSYTQREFVTKKGITKLEELDLTSLLRVANKSWYTMCGYTYIPARERECIRDMIGVRNNWAHVSAVLPGKDAITYDIECLMRFFSQMGQMDLLPSLEHLKTMTKQPGPFKPGQPSSRTALAENRNSVQPQTSQQGNITEKSIVYIVGSPEVKGMVASVSQLGDTKKYEVFVDGSLKTYYEGQLALVETTPAFKWIDTETLRSYLSAYQINHPSARNLYSLNSARIDFVPYQFKPALKLIKADEPRILIADSVGVGKTIEAGLIIKELQARSDLENIIVICPKPLVVDRKWENEMKRFDEDFMAVDGGTLRQIISDTDRDGGWPARYAKAIIPYSILDAQAYHGSQTYRRKSIGLEQLDPAPHFDLVIIDEAHRLRNGSMDKEKAFQYKCVHFFCEHADAVVMLTATPLQTKDDDLFTLLNLLRPDIVIDKKSFDMMMRPNPFISNCAHLIRAAKENWKSEALTALTKVLDTQWGENVTAKNPLFDKCRGVLRQPIVTREERVELITDIESLNSFNTMLNRTRRKDIQSFCIRRIHTLESDFTPTQRRLHDALLAFEVEALSHLHGDRGLKFMISTLRRQAASCIYGLAPHICDILDRRFEQLTDEIDYDFEDGDFKNLDLSVFRNHAKNILEMAEQLPEDDPKFDSILQIIREKQKYEDNKVIIFSTFRYTLHYIKRKLRAAGFRVEQIDGSVSNEDRLDFRERFELPRENPDAIDIMLFTEVSSEGLDYQFCNMMINFDLPWNPMRIEQRIGRIDRRGQKSQVVNIYNAITSGTVDADIYNRCLVRIGVFERSIGECEDILGEIGAKIEAIALDPTLSDAERKLQLEQIADNEVRKAQALDQLESEEKELFGFDLSNYTLSKELCDAESPFLSAKSLQHLVEMYLQQRLSGANANYILGDPALKTLRLNVQARSKLLEDHRKLPGDKNGLRRKWEYYLKGNIPNHPITFDAEAAEKNRTAFFITPTHPLLRQAAAYFATNETVHIHLEYRSPEIPAGDYPFYIYAWDYIGIRSDFKLVYICPEAKIAEELAEYILTANAVYYSSSLGSEAWVALEKQHIQQWQTARKKHKESTRQMARYKLESLKNNYLNRKAVLEDQIAGATDTKIAVMRRSELESATQRYQKKVAEIEADIAKADIHTVSIAQGIITVIGQ